MEVKDFRDRPRLDAVHHWPFRVVAEVIEGAVPDDPKFCAVAVTFRHQGFEARVLREIVLVEAPATRVVIRHNKDWDNPQAEGVRVGDLIHYRYRLCRKAGGARVVFDSAHGYEPGFYELRAPTWGFRIARDKQSSTRRERTDAHRDGTTPKYERKAQMMRVRSLNEELRANEETAG